MRFSEGTKAFLTSLGRAFCDMSSRFSTEEVIGEMVL
jgi:hypothetical protein